MSSLVGMESLLLFLDIMNPLVMINQTGSDWVSIKSMSSFFWCFLLNKKIAIFKNDLADIYDFNLSWMNIVFERNDMNCLTLVIRNFIYSTLKSRLLP